MLTVLLTDEFRPGVRPRRGLPGQAAASKQLSVCAGDDDCGCGGPYFASSGFSRSFAAFSRLRRALPRLHRSRSGTGRARRPAPATPFGFSVSAECSPDPGHPRERPAWVFRSSGSPFRSAAVRNRGDICCSMSFRILQSCDTTNPFVSGIFRGPYPRRISPPDYCPPPEPDGGGAGIIRRPSSGAAIIRRRRGASPPAPSGTPLWPDRARPADR